MPAATRWMLRDGHEIDLSEPRLLAVVNLTPDSFHAPSRAMDGASARRAALEAWQGGAVMIDCGAESTRPGAKAVEEGEQIARLGAILGDGGQDVAAGLWWSVDTTRARVARHAIERGMHAINDVSAGLDDGAMLRVAAELGCGLVLMHRVSPPGRDSYSDRYVTPPMTGDVVEQVREFLRHRAEAAIDAGVDPARICLDPGFGFGKTVEQNMDLVRGIGVIVDLGFPVLAGISRKSFVGRVSAAGRETTPEERLPGTLALTLALVDRGVRLFRVHDVAEHAAALRAWEATCQG